MLAGAPAPPLAFGGGAGLPGGGAFEGVFEGAGDAGCELFGGGALPGGELPGGEVVPG